MKLAIRSTKTYRKQYRKLAKSGYDMTTLGAAIDRLASGELLPQQFHDHPLRGDFAGSRECHIGSDWLLRYSKDGKMLILFLISTGTHRDVLGIE